MRKERRNLLLAAFLAVALAGGVVWLIYHAQGPPEPVYQGKRLSVWMAMWKPGMTAFDLRTLRTVQAVRQIGTNGIPTYLRMLREHDSNAKLKLIGLTQKQHLINISIVGAEQRNWEALQAFTLLGAEASNAVPELIQIYEENISDVSRQFAARSLGAIGPPAEAAVLVLLWNATNTGASIGVRVCSIAALGQIHADPESVVPALINGLNKDADPNVRMFTVPALASFGSDAKPAVPALVNMLKNPDPWIVNMAGQALKRTDPKAAAMAGIK